MPYDKEHLATAMRVKRAERKWSQEDLASKLGLSGATVFKWETGKAVPAFDNVCKMADLFGCSVDDFAVKG